MFLGITVRVFLLQYDFSQKTLSHSTPVSSTNKADRHNIDTTEIMLKVALHAITLTNTFVY